MLTRRWAAGLLGAALAAPALAQAKLRVVIVGGGAGGLGAARALQADPRIELTLVEKQKIYQAPWLINAQLARLNTELDYGYEAVAARGTRVVIAEATAVDVPGRRLVLAAGDPLPWDRLILAPGIAFQAGPPGMEPDTAAWTSDARISRTAGSLEAVPDGGTVVIATPPLPMRCPPAPYERASMFAHRLRSTGRKNARVMILDAKENGALLGLFQPAWEELQPGQVEWLPPSIHGGVQSVTSDEVVTGLDTIKASLICIIPPHGAGALAKPFTDASGWCPVDPATMRVRGVDGVFIVGDSAVLSPIPKSAVLAAASGRVAAAAIRAELDGGAPGAVVLENLCFARLAPGNAIRSADRFALKDGVLTPVESSVSGARESGAVRAATYADAEAWAKRFGAELFGP